MKEEDIINKITIQNYIKIYLLRENIFDKIKINFNLSNDKILNNHNKYNNLSITNYIIHYYKDLHYKLNKHSVIISVKDNLYLNTGINFKSCKKNILTNNPCSIIKKNAQNAQNAQNVDYNIIIGFKQEFNKKDLKLRTPLNIIHLKCYPKNKDIDENIDIYSSKIEKLLKKNKTIRDYISYVIVEKNKK